MPELPAKSVTKSDKRKRTMNLNERIDKKMLEIFPSGKVITQAYEDGKRLWITPKAQWMAWNAYALLFGNDQSVKRIAERGGFGEEELNAFYPEWRNHIVK